MEETKNQCSDLIIKAAIKKKPKFKAGSGLSGKVNLKSVEVNVDDVSTEDTSAFEIMMHFRGCISEDINRQDAK